MKTAKQCLISVTCLLFVGMAMSVPSPVLAAEPSVSISVSPGTSVSYTEKVTLTAEVSDPAQVASYRWAHVGGWHRIGTQQSVTLGGAGWPNGPGKRTFQAIVTLHNDSQVTAEQDIIFTNPSPPSDVSVSISVSPDTSVPYTEEVTLTAEVSGPAQVTSYRWAHVGGSQNIGTQQSVTLGGTAWPNGPGTRTFRAIVTLNGGSQVTATQAISFTKPEDATLARIRRDFVGDATTVEEFVRGLPAYHKDRGIFLLESQAGDAEFVSPDTPRVVSWGETADDLFSWGTNDQSPRYDEVEFITKEYGEWVFGVIDFTASPPALSKETEACHSCHVNAHPIWGSYYRWPGTLAYIDIYNNLYDLGYDDFDRDDWLDGLQSSEDPRVNQVPIKPDHLMSEIENKGVFPEDAIAARHGEVLAESLRSEGGTIDDAEELLCPDGSDTTLSDVNAAMEALFPVAHLPHAMRDSDGTVRDVDKHQALKVANESLELGGHVYSVMAMYLIDYLVEHDETVKALYEGLSNEETVDEDYRYYLHYPPKTATALDELDSRSDILFNLKGSANIDYRSRISRDMSSAAEDQMVVRRGHLAVMIPKVCGVLYPEE